MEFVANNERSKETLRRELKDAGFTDIRPATSYVDHTDVPDGYEGFLGKMFFFRRWDYWHAHGRFSYDVMVEVYKNEDMRPFVLIHGQKDHTPERWKNIGFIDTYHISSPEGLKYFVDTMKRLGLDKD